MNIDMKFYLLYSEKYRRFYYSTYIINNFNDESFIRIVSIINSPYDNIVLVDYVADKFCRKLNKECHN